MINRKGSVTHNYNDDDTVSNGSNGSSGSSGNSGNSSSSSSSGSNGSSEGLQVHALM